MQFSTREGISNEWRMRPGTARTRRMRVPGHATLDQDRAAAVPGERVRKLGGMHHCPPFRKHHARTQHFFRRIPTSTARSTRRIVCFGYRRHEPGLGLRLKPNVKLVLMALADACDDEGYCWPSVPALARKTSLDHCRVQRILNQPKAGGLIRVAPRFRQDRSPNSNGHRLALNHSAGEGIGWARIGG